MTGAKKINKDLILRSGQIMRRLASDEIQRLTSRRISQVQPSCPSIFFDTWLPHVPEMDDDSSVDESDGPFSVPEYVSRIANLIADAKRRLTLTNQRSFFIVLRLTQHRISQLNSIIKISTEIRHRTVFE